MQKRGLESGGENQGHARPHATYHNQIYMPLFETCRQLNSWKYRVAHPPAGYLGSVQQTEGCMSNRLGQGTFTVATTLLMAAAESSSPFGCSTSVIPRYLRLKVIPSSRVSLVSVQFSGSSGGVGIDS